MARRGLSLLLALWLLLAVMPVSADESAPVPVMRALLISCDDFVSQPDTAPSSYNNLVALRRALLYDIRGYRSIRVSVDQALDADSFSRLAAEAFAGAGPEDISLFYLSTHGVLVAGSSDFTALMSDGRTESFLSGRDIHQALRDIPGKKVIILDACFSGAAINKGMDAPFNASVFSGADFKVLTSAGGLEPSFLWTDGAGTVQGGSFFASALTEGITAEGRYAADQNRDGLITLRELHRHQMAAYGASTPQVYPQNDDFVVFAYYTGQVAPRLRAVTGFQVESPLISAASEPIRFSYTLNQEARLAYQLVYEAGGAWHFREPQSIAERGRGDGIVRPGRKEAEIGLAQPAPGLSGYFLLMLVSVFEDRASPQACVLLSVQTQETDPLARIEQAAGFTPGKGEEAAFIIRHAGPVQYSAWVVDAADQRVATLASQMVSRPLHLNREGSCLWWDGRLQDGGMAPAGAYRLRLRMSAGGRQVELEGAPFRLLEGSAP